MHFEADFVREKLTSIGDISNHVDLVNAHAGTPPSHTRASKQF
jgi:hypothetical protein